MTLDDYLKLYSDPSHAIGVCELSRILLHQTDEIFKLNLKEHEKELLIGAKLHDIGRIGGDLDHNVIGEKIFLDKGLLGLNEGEKELIAALIRFHKGPVKKLEKLPKEKRKLFTQMLAILRIADGLENKKNNLTTIQNTLYDVNNRLVCFVIKDKISKKAIKKKKLYEDTFNVQVIFKTDEKDICPITINNIDFAP